MIMIVLYITKIMATIGPKKDHIIPYENDSQHLIKEEFNAIL